MNLIDTIPFWIMVAALYGFCTYLTESEENYSLLDEAIIPRNLINTIYFFVLTLMCVCIFLLSLFIEISWGLIKSNMNYRFLASLIAVFFSFLPLTASNINQSHYVKKGYMILLVCFVVVLIAWSVYPSIILNIFGYKFSITHLVWITGLLLGIAGAKILRRLFWDNVTGI